MWTRVARFILRNRLLVLIILALVTAFLAYYGRNVRMSYTYAKLLPEKDSVYLEDEYFKSMFGEGANIFVIGIQDSSFFTVDKFNAWQQTINDIKSIDSVTDVLSVTQVVNLKVNRRKRKFVGDTIFPNHVESQKQLDSLVRLVKTLPFYKNYLYNDKSHTYWMAVSIDKKILNNKQREATVDSIVVKSKIFAKQFNVKLHYSGLPYVRTAISQKIKKELLLFMLLALFVTALILYLFFHSFKVVFFSLLVVALGSVWAFGILALFNYEITILTGMIPPLLIVIGVPNSIFLLNKYHSEFKKHGNKIKALQRVISKTGNAIFLTNLTTACGFATFALTSSSVLVEFGIVASINIFGVFILAITLIPIFFSFLALPKRRHVQHLDRKHLGIFIKLITKITLRYRNVVYIVTCIVLLIVVFGVSRLKITGYMIDDIPESDPIFQDLMFFETQFGGIIPFEILVDTKHKNGALELKTLRKIDTLQHELLKYKQFSKSMSIADAAKFLRQAYRGGNPKRYKMPIERERLQIARYLKNANDKRHILNSFIDSTKQITRISLSVKDIGTQEMNTLKKNVNKDLKKIFPSKDYKVIITGSSVVYSRGTRYLIKNLVMSLAIAVVLIALFMSFMFYSWRMVVISLIPNFIPLLITAALMGFIGIPIKISTILVFSIAFGISVDDTIHYLSKYRQELSHFNWNITKSVVAALNETGVSMMYTSVVLFFGFSIFTISGFGGTQALGILVSITLFFAMISNLVLLPSLLMTLEKIITTKAFREPLIHIFNEDEDIDLTELKVELKQNKSLNIINDNIIDED